MKRILLAVLFCILPGLALAQSPFTPAVSIGKESGPINIEADALEVRDKNNTATFIGNVVVRRNDVTIRAGVMKVLYQGNAMPGATAEPSAAPNQQIKRIDMSGRVLFAQKDQQATGDSATYDKGAEMLTMHGNVVLTQGQNVARGQKLIVNMRNGAARLEGRPNMILMPESTPPTRGK